MGFLAFLLLGLIAGAAAKLILPGRQGGNWIATLVIGVVGALLGGWLGGLLFGGRGLGTFFELRTWLFAVTPSAPSTASLSFAATSQTLVAGTSSTT